jgi:hypothetical protein
LVKKDVKIYTLKISDNENIKDISLESIEHPAEVNINSRINLKLKIKSLQYKGRSINIRTLINDKPYSTGNINIQNGVNHAQVPISIKKTGVNKITIQCDPLKDEAIELNNQKTIFIRTIKSKFKVLLVYGTPSYEFKFLSLALKNDPNINHEAYLKIKDNLSGIRSLKKFDLIILGNIKYDDVPESMVNEILTYANDQAGALLFLGGKNGFVQGGYHLSKLKNIFPVRWDKNNDYLKTDFNLKLTARGINSQAMQIISELGRLQDFWNNLPPCNHINIIKKVKPGTEILATHSKQENLIALAIGKYKQTRVGIFTPYPTWKWGFLNIGMGYEQNPFENFWQQLVRYMVNINQEKINLFTNKLKYFRNEDIYISLTLFDKNNKPIRKNSVRAVILKKVKNQYIKIDDNLILTPSASTAGLYENVINQKEYGEYKISARIDDKDVNTFFVLQPPSEELYKLQAQNSLLKNLSDKTKGEFLTLNSLSQLKDLIQKKQTTRRIKKEVNLWSTWFLLVCVIALLSMEWYIRKRNGLM